ncbi:type I secretion system permease/ATPase [Maricaulis salignorans]|uniref:ATP-binding protein HasD n=1 Tax=Maricaulis salignorans TaxID=144026 RepID=A0A1G9LX36_9PROT|nr:type I secretion system permease/ATPase [Maricaulis salignorans]SDL66496.1 ATP-binding protein HasD [Maricaulis salignorans]
MSSKSAQASASSSRKELRDNDIVKAALGAARGSVINLTIFSFGLNLLVLTGPIYMLQVYDRVLSSRSIDTLLAVSLLAAVMYVAYGGLEFVRSALFSRIGTAAERKMGPRLIDAVMRANLAAGSRSNQALQDMRTLRNFISSPAPGVIFDVPWSPLFIIVMALIHPILGVFCVASIVLLGGLALANQARSRGKLKDAGQASAAADLTADAAFSSLESIEAMGMRGELERRWLERNEKSLDLNSGASESIAQYSSATKALRVGLQSAVLGVGAWLAVLGDITPGMMIAGSILLGRALAPIEQAIGQWRPALMAYQSYNRLSELLEVAQVPKDKMSLPAATGILRVEKVYAGPPTGQTHILKGVSFGLEPGDGLGVIGPSGGGKSTLAKVLLGLWPPLSGAVRLDGASLEDWSRDELGPQVGYLSQTVDLLPGTVADNISRFRPRAEPATIVEAARKAGAHDLILRLADGYDTNVGEGGRNLSAGQRQRVGLARALYGNPVFVVLDEPNSNLDKEGEDALLKALVELRKSKTTLVVIAHRPSILGSCNKVMVLADGQVRGFGPRDEVLSGLAAASKEKQNG